MAQQIGTRQIPALSDRDPNKQQFFEEVKFRLDNLATPPPDPGGGGTSSGSNALIGTGQVATALPAFTVITSNATGQIVQADSNNQSHIDRILGVTSAASAADGSVTFVRYGELTDPGWNWDVGKRLFVGENGSITQDPFTGVFSQMIGQVLSPTKISIRIASGILRA